MERDPLPAIWTACVGVQPMCLFPSTSFRVCMYIGEKEGERDEELSRARAILNLEIFGAASTTTATISISWGSPHSPYSRCTHRETHY